MTASVGATDSGNLVSTESTAWPPMAASTSGKNRGAGVPPFVPHHVDASMTTDFQSSEVRSSAVPVDVVLSSSVLS